MSDIRWEDPPPARANAPGIWTGRLAPLIAHPKRWAIVHTSKGSRQTVRDLRAGRLKIPPGRWEFASRTVDNESRVYARYLGPDQDGDTS